MSKIRVGHPHRDISGYEVEQLHHSKELREDIAAGALLEALPRFIENLSSGRSWNPTRAGRAGILTYWTNALASETYRAIGRWANEQHQLTFDAIRVDDLVARGSEPSVAGVGDDDSATLHAQRKTLRQLLPAAREGRHDRSTVDTRAIAALMLAGYEPKEIAERLHLDVRRVWYLTSKLRDLGWRQGTAAGPWAPAAR